MLLQLSIRNYAIIDELSFQPDAGLSILTGETGAGKSIMLGALSLILGERADSTVLINKSEKCVVEAVFDVAHNEHFRTALRTEKLDDESECIVRREIAVNGKSRAFINDTPVTLATLNRLTSLLVDLHQQFDHLALQDDTFQLDVLDAVGKSEQLRAAYQKAYQSLRRQEAEIERLQQEELKRQKEADYKQYLLQELDDASFKPHEIEDADGQLKSLTHSEKIQTVLGSTRALFSEGEQPLLQQLKRAAQQLQGIAEWLPAASELAGRLNSSYLELKDLSDEVESQEGSLVWEPALMERLQERLDLGYKLLKKHGLNETNELLKLQEDLRKDAKSAGEMAEKLEAMLAERDSLREELDELGAGLHAKRADVTSRISGEVTRLLALVGMPNARFEVSLRKCAEPGPYGMDEVQFLLDANKSGQYLPLHKAASGGEMSRIMLSIKSLTAQAMELPTLIFDEVDTGISGEAARQVGMLLQSLSQFHQVICITHQPQVAARGSKHFFVYKDGADLGRITTKLRTLEGEDRIQAIAHMIGGEKPGAAAIEHARGLVET